VHAQVVSHPSQRRTPGKRMMRQVVSRFRRRRQAAATYGAYPILIAEEKRAAAAVYSVRAR